MLYYNMVMSGFGIRSGSTIALSIVFILMCFTETVSQSGMRFEKIDPSKGLSTNSISCIIQDSKGFMWFGTRDGINRYDGIKIKTIRFSTNYNIITSICELKSGAILVGTMSGGIIELNPVNERYKSYQLEYSGNFTSAVFIHEDNQGIIWVIDDFGSILQFDIKHKNFVNYRSNALSQSPTDKITYFHEASDGTIWLGTANNGVIKYNRNGGTFEQVRSQTGELLPFANEIFTDQNERTWIATKNGLFYKTKDAPYFTEVAHEQVFNAIWEDLEGVIWVSYGQELLSFDEVTHMLEHKNSIKGTYILPHIIDLSPVTRNSAYLNQSNVGSKSVVVDDNNRFWIITSDGLDIYDPVDSKILPVRAEDESTDIGANKLTTLMKDRSNTLWLGTVASGVRKYTPSLFVHYPFLPNTQGALGNKVVHAIIVTDNNHAWVGQIDGIFAFFDRGNGSFKRFKIPESNSAIFDILPKENELWLATYGDGIVNYNIINNQYTYYRHTSGDTLGLQSSKVQCIFEDGNGNLLIGSDIGLELFDPKSKKSRSIPLVDNDGNSVINVFTIFRTDSTLWIGTLGQGLFQMHPDTHVYRNYKANDKDSASINHNYITSIHADMEDADKIWLGTYGGGINVFSQSNRSFKHYGKESGLKNTVVYGIMEDTTQRVWFSSNAGVAIFDKAKGKVVRDFDVNDGLQANEFNRGSYAVFPDGTMAFGGVNGLNEFNPYQSNLTNYEPNIVLTDFKVFNNTRPDILDKINNKQDVVLPHDNNFISIDFSVLDYRNTHRNEYAYRLKGLVESWTYVTNERPFANYTNLPSGQYNFELRATNSEGVWLQSMVSIPIFIQSPFWKTWWFLSVVLIFIISLVLFIHKWKVRSITRQKEVLDELVKERTIVIQSQNEEIMTQNENIRLLNHQLEFKVKARTKSLEESNKRLLQYAHDNAHKVRAPLARLLGLVYLNKISKNEDMRVLMEKIGEAARELDEITRALGRNLTERTGIDPFDENSLSE
ncbi:hypothetical protein JMN32_19530 [Fulvivirga sp. 29W222]|uniref:Two component regulator three Y domain-containing protein n=1 Tax=Fulvivirga marina TaxID=2494733 RepID=A0A937G4X9_9BACT|nr:two-component regulator propeller domain-containing protein [Fulvivirga marina]MBL6448511.1 hypothetical protein [Fulvivirga marina]